jgi:hypothetical protein
MKGFQAIREAFRPLRRTPALPKHEISSLFCGHFAFLNPDPDSHSESGPAPQTQFNSDSKRCSTIIRSVPMNDTTRYFENIQNRYRNFFPTVSNKKIEFQYLFFAQDSKYTTHSLGEIVPKKIHIFLDFATTRNVETCK